MVKEKFRKGFSSFLLILFVASILLAGFYIKEGKLTLGTFRGIANYECNVPILITLGDIDPRFKLSNSTILEDIDAASQVWENAKKENLFIFDGKSKSKVIVNFVYDQRQQEAIASRAAKTALENGWANYENLITSRKAIDNQYESAKNIYEKELEEYNQDAKTYENHVSAWNRSQGSRTEYLALKSEESKVASEFNILEKQRIVVNNLADKLNSSNTAIQNLYKSLSKQTDEYNKQFASDNQITVGEYDGTYTINIYQYISPDQLKITLAHELGHALGMNHTENEKSIMYPFQGKQDGKNLTLTSEDLAELNRVCKK
jgi:hypothetical protein